MRQPLLSVDFVGASRSLVMDLLTILVFIGIVIFCIGGGDGTDIGWQV